MSRKSRNIVRRTAAELRAMRKRGESKNWYQESMADRKRMICVCKKSILKPVD